MNEFKYTHKFLINNNNKIFKEGVMSSLSAGLLRSHYSPNSNGLITLVPNNSSRSILRIREKYLLILVVVVFVVFSVIGVAFLPELTASNVYRY